MNWDPVRDKKYILKRSVYKSLQITNTAKYHSACRVDTHSRGTKVEKMLTLAPERYTAGFCMVAKVILWCI